MHFFSKKMCFPELEASISFEATTFAEEDHLESMNHK